MTGQTTAPALEALARHFADLRDGCHGDQAVSRTDKEALFATSAGLLTPVARRVLEEVDEVLLLGSGRIEDSGAVRAPDGGLARAWSLIWPAQELAGIAPIRLVAHFGAGFHHPHLRGGTVAEWPCNVFTPEQAEDELPTLRAIASAELHNLVFMADYRIVPATVRRREST